MPSPLSTNVTPVGRVPVSVEVPVGLPAVVTRKVPLFPTLKVALSALVTLGAKLTFKAKFWVAGGLTPLSATKLRLKTPPFVGVPLKVAVPSPLSTNVTPGSVPVSVIAGAGNPLVVTVNVPFAPRVKLVVFALVICGASFTTMIKF